MATIAVGADLGELRELYAPRLEEIGREYTVPMDELLEEVTEAERTLVELQRRRDADTTARWHRYRAGYEQYLTEGTDSESETIEDAPQRRIWNPAKPIATGTTADAQESEVVR
jgi:hypothetical protein